MKKYFFLIILLLKSILILSSNITYSEKNIKARELIFDFKFLQAEKLLNTEKTPVSLYLKSYLYFIKNITLGGDKNYEIYTENFDKTVEIIKNTDKNDSLKKIFLSEIYLQSAIVELLNKDFLSGSYHFIKSHSFFEESEKEFPNLQYRKKLSGLYKIIAGITPEKGKKFLSIIGLEGNIKDGYKDLEIYLNYTKTKGKNYLLTEALSIKYLVFSFLKEDLFLKKFEDISLLKNNENKSTIILSEILNNYKTGNYKQIQTNIKKLKEKKIIDIPVVYYMSGVLLTTENIELSKQYLLKFIETTKSTHFVKSGYWQLARISILKNNKKEFEFYKQKTLNKGQTFTEADKQAEYEAESVLVPNKYLLKSRLLFDAKKYNNALIELQQINKENLKEIEKAEYYYRKGRIYFEQKNYKKAKYNFAMVLKNYSEVEKYFIPYSALNSAYIYVEENNKEKAKTFFNLALKLNNFEYKNSIKHKAESGIKQL